MLKFSPHHTRHCSGPARPARIASSLAGRARPLRKSNDDGFTLVELMVVIVIIGLLAAVVAFNVLPMGDKARVEKAKADISTIDQALEMFKLQNLHYPNTSEGLQALVSPPMSADPSRYQVGGYLKKLPNDPWGHPYQYASPGQHGEVDVWSWGADGKQGGEGIDADIGSWQ